ncbi:MAG: hypothetical protein DCF30_21890 [Hyphomicrobiales bacterium]|nr:MAG: hypothetical protein DCF30_21890 [Hyphomicrobiales bacterium]
MPLIPFARILTSWLGQLLLAAAVYLLWTWWTGEIVTDPQGFDYRLREDWRGWTAAGLFAWSVLGRWPTTLLMARRDSDPSAPRRADGVMIDSPTGSKLYVETRGSPNGPVVIATHGWGLDSTIWQYLNRDLETHRSLIPHQQINWDLPGLGRSKPPVDGTIALEIFARDLAHLIERVSPRPVVLIGHSIGGMTIQTLARDRPDLFKTRVAGVVLIDTTYTNPLRTMISSKLALALRRPVLEPVFKLAILLKPIAWLGAWQGYLNGTAHIANRLQFGKYVTRSQLEHTTLLGTRNSPAILAKGNLALFDWDATGAVAKMDCPVLLLCGDLDIVTKLEASEAIQKMASEAILEPISGANHMGFLEQSGHYNTRAIDFIAARCVEAQPVPAAGPLRSS